MSLLDEIKVRFGIANRDLFNPQGSDVMPPPGATLNVRMPPRYQSCAPASPPPEASPAKPDCVQAALDLFEIAAQWSGWQKAWLISDKRAYDVDTDLFVPAGGYRVSRVLVGADADYETWMKAITAISTSSQSSEIPADKMENFGE